jgi:hypothetical protein
MQGSEPPTALSWLRRRGPPLPEAVLHKLFRQEAVRLYSPADQRVTRVSKGRALAPGTMLLLPKAAVAADEQWGSTQQHLATEGEPAARRGLPAARRGLPPAQEQARGEWVARLQASLLHHDSELIALNKPAGLACQGGSGVAFSLDTLMAEAFGSLPGTRADQLRLVHRLDRQTTGGMGGQFAPLLKLGSSTAQALQWVGARAAFMQRSAPSYWFVSSLPPCLPPSGQSLPCLRLRHHCRHASDCQEPRCCRLAGGSLPRRQQQWKQQQLQQQQQPGWRARQRPATLKGSSINTSNRGRVARQHPQDLLGCGRQERGLAAHPS